MSKTVGCIGLGNMGRAILDGLITSNAGYAYAGYDINQSAAVELKERITVCSTAAQCSEKSDILILAVKPGVMKSVLPEIKTRPETVYISIAAGMTISTIENYLGSSSKIIRVMPNTPSLIGHGMSVLAPGNSVTDSDLEEAEALFRTIGKTLILPEPLLNAVTGVSGCGPAYVYTCIQAMADGGVKMGLSRTDAVLLAAQTLLGAAHMVMETGQDPITLRNMVTSPGGSTIAAIHKLESHGFSGALMDAVEEATHVTERLGKNK